MNVFELVFSFSSDIYLWMELLDHIVVLFLILWGTAIQFSIVYNPIRVPKSPFLHILTQDGSPLLPLAAYLLPWLRTLLTVSQTEQRLASPPAPALTSSWGRLLLHPPGCRAGSWQPHCSGPPAMGVCPVQSCPVQLLPSLRTWSWEGLLNRGETANLGIVSSHTFSRNREKNSFLSLQRIKL